ncbi:unnamed protein product [Clonostachys solani]|uniref:Uncharacterized protein n=1 Tax=Clonostachys solani TaxID=160281 RepID=A0A9N9ZA78_9HYPO|nr:unnamed protein product [Clonostachys solani]
MGKDLQNYIQAVKAIFEARLKEEPAGLVGLLTEGSEDVRSLLRSACLIAFRHEIWSVLIHGRTFEIPLSSVDDDVTFDWTSEDQFDWMNRILIWLACILRLCYGTYQDDRSAPNGSTTFSSVSERWRILKRFLDRWDQKPPSCFEPLWYEERDVAKGRLFPRVYMATSCQVIALQNIELARITLAVYDPTRKRLGLDVAAREKETADLVRRSLWRICGLALSNPYQVSMVAASLGIVLCSDYIEGRREQAAIVDILVETERDHAWPTKWIAEQLWERWKLGDIGEDFSSLTRYLMSLEHEHGDIMRTPVGKVPWSIIYERRLVDGFFSVSEAEIRDALKLVLERFKLVIEPSAALPLAVALFNEDFCGMVEREAGEQGWDLGIVFRGGNVDTEKLAMLFDEQVAPNM